MNKKSFIILAPWASAIKLLRPVYILFCSKLERLSLLVTSTLACKYWIRMEVTESGKRYSLLWYGVSYSHKKFNDTGQAVNVINFFSSSMTFASK